MFEKISKGEWTIPHFVKKQSENDCGCGFIFAIECEEVVAGIYYKKDDSFEQSEHPDVDTAKANAEFICFCGNLQQRYDISKLEDAVTLLELLNKPCLPQDQHALQESVNEFLSEIKR